MPKRTIYKYEDYHKEIDKILYKKCVCHHEYFPEEDVWLPCTSKYFYKNNKNKKDGLSPTCKKCDSKKSFKNQKDNWERTQQTKHKWHIKHRQRVIDKCKKWREDNIEWKQEYQSLYLKSHPEKVAQYNEYRRNHKTHQITKTEWIACKEYFDNCCAYCNMPVEIHKEKFNQDLHKEHVDSNGSNELDNCIPSCSSCNYHKWEYTIKEWYTPENPMFSEERLNKILAWINGDYKNFLSPKNNNIKEK